MPSSSCLCKIHNEMFNVSDIISTKMCSSVKKVLRISPPSDPSGNGKTILCDHRSDGLWHLPRGFESYHRRSKFDSVLHTENDDVLYRFSAIISLISI